MKAMKWLAATVAIFSSAAAFGQAKIVLGHTGIADYAAAYIAQEEGFFKKRGVDVEFQQVFGPALAPGLQSGSMQVTTMTPASFLLAVDGGLKFVAVANTTASVKTDKHYALVAKTGSNISSVKDLVGKKVGVPGLGLTLHIMAKKALIDQGIDASKVDFIEVPFAQLNDVLRGGGVDAVATAEPFLGRTVQAKVGSVVEYFFEKLPEETSPVFYVSSADWEQRTRTHSPAFDLRSRTLLSSLKRIQTRSGRLLANSSKFLPTSWRPSRCHGCLHNYMSRKWCSGLTPFRSSPC
ncbi:MAG: ABC transporter substrate-binding protein [Simplicispira sp.]|nr:ABC transporter substrate-binding protein [Simplicispira sp.]